MLNKSKGIYVILLLLFFFTSNVNADSSKIWAGKWDTSYGKLNLKQYGNKVRGTYGSIGIIEATASKRRGKHILKGMFTNRSRRGTFMFTLSNDHKFRGKWKWSSEAQLSKTWNGSKKVQQNWSGKWKTTFGVLTLRQYNNVVSGTYRNIGIIEAKVVNGKLKGRFTNKTKEGTFVFRSRGNNRFTGQWKWKGNSKWRSQKWTGRKIN